MSTRATGRKVLNMLFSVFLATMILSACSSPSEETLPSPQPTEAPEEGQTITLITPDSSNLDIDTTKYQIQTRLTDFQLLSESEGLAWGVTKNELRMYMTRDNGQTWVNISPAANVQFPSNPVYGKEIFFTDPKNGWIIRSSFGSSETVVLRTKDGGQSWKISPLANANSASSIFFISETHGWLMISWDSTANKESKTLYATSDGGATWKAVMKNEQYNPNLSNPSIPVPGVTTGMIFRDAKHGFVTLQTATLPKLYATSDGGNTWRTGAPFLQNDSYAGCDRIITGKPEFFGQGKTNGWLPVSCQKDRDDSIEYHAYFTANGGDNWKFVPFSLKGKTGLNRHIPPTFLNLQTGWILDGNMLYHTEDQGTTWKPLPASSVLQSKLLEYPEIVKLQFFSTDVGWLLIEKKEDKRSILLQTTNGGVSWRVM